MRRNVGALLYKVRLLFILFAGIALYGEIPAFISEPLHSPNAARIECIVSSTEADAVIIDGGLEQGFRVGMVCRVDRDMQSIAELIIIKSQSDRSVALILELADQTSIKTGDQVRVKTFENS